MRNKWTIPRAKMAKWVTSGSVLWIITTVALAVAVFFLVQPLTLEHIARAQVKTNPFTLELESYDVSDSSTGTLIAKETVARRSDGATVRVASIAGLVGLQADETARQIWLPDGQEFTVYDGVEAAIRFPMLSAQALALQKEKVLNPPGNCIFPGETLTGYGTQRGYKVAIVKVGPIGDNEVTAWYAPDLGCEKLQYRVEAREPDGSMKLVSETRAVSLTTGEPDARLFDVPDSYAKVAPSEAMRREASRLGVSWTPDMQREADIRDAAYLGHKPAKTGTR